MICNLCEKDKTIDKEALQFCNRNVCSTCCDRDNCSICDLVYKLQEQIEKMKCCGNCRYYRSFVGADMCDIDKSVPFEVVQGDKKACEKWEFGL